MSKAAEVVRMDVQELIDMLNEALSAEILAAWQYWIGGQIAVGMLRPDVEEELMGHYEDETGHAETLVARILQLGGMPLVSPEQWISTSPSPFAAPTDPKTPILLAQNIKGEQDAIQLYTDIMAAIGDSDPTTYNILNDIIDKECEHELDLQRLLNDIS